MPTATDEEVDFIEAVRENIFVTLGHGIVDVDGVVQALTHSDYAGWYVLEQDVMLESSSVTVKQLTDGVAESKRVLEERLAASGPSG